MIRCFSIFRPVHRERFSAPDGCSWIDTVSGILPPVILILTLFVFPFETHNFFQTFGKYAAVYGSVNSLVREAERLIFKLCTSWNLFWSPPLFKLFYKKILSFFVFKNMFSPSRLFIANSRLKVLITCMYGHTAFYYSCMLLICLKSPII